MSTFDKYIHRFEITTGLKCEYKIIENNKYTPLYIKKNFILLKINLLDTDFIALFSDNASSEDSVRAMSVIRKNFIKYPIALFSNKIREIDKKVFLNRGIPFFCSNGEMFLPFLGTRLYSFKSINNKSRLSRYSQEIFVLLLYIIQSVNKNESKINITRYDSPINVYNNKIGFTGGDEFIKYFEKYIDIRNRSTLSRSLSELEEQSIISSIGNTRNKEYFIGLDSYSLLMNYKELLKNPLYKKKYYISENLENEMNEFFDHNQLKDFVYVGDMALSNSSMISEHSYSEISLYQKENKVLKDIVDASTTAKFDDWIYDLKYILQFSKYDLLKYNKFYRDFVDFSYPKKTIDPINLFLSLDDKNDERLIDGINELVDNRLK
ncbi:hypothetical protein M3M35_04210 [Fructilactobacillus myrtifloralis]|uniref:Uncharacterized protein n=1 Tax=Fructilactobacillus myrtifloralis TaxID=2940301 RepID=A0ABY5BLU6_9LACO|nr:hypothetical protein [Fructilactobacillus myrtifloralis]USS84530.1 hypothetical protein M3M35_04210 [Fructilactobacillus myrtifloralis]